MDPHACWLRCANGLHLAYPDIGFALFSLAPLIPLFSRVRRNAHKGFLGYASQHLSGLRTHGQHRLHEKSPSSFVADVSHSADLVTMGQIDVGRILHHQNHGRGSGLFPGLLKVGLHQGTKGDIWLDLRKRYNALVSFQVCICAGSEPKLLAACIARLVRRLSCSWTPPQVRSAQLLGSNKSYVFILYSITW